jgi:uncharacterized protein (DUF924 family)
MSTADEVLAYWLDELGPKGWYEGGAELDAEIRTRFEADWQQAMAGGLGLWLTYPSGVLAYLILTDQFSRNMFRGTAAAYRSDRLALPAARRAVARNWDLTIDPPARQFFYMPFEHSESLPDQEHSVRLMKERMPASPELLLHARAHREVIRKFGRFPYRNAHLGRNSTAAETAYVEAGGYRVTLAALKVA